MRLSPRSARRASGSFGCLVAYPTCRSNWRRSIEIVVEVSTQSLDIPLKGRDAAAISNWLALLETSTQTEAVHKTARLMRNGQTTQLL